MSLCAIIPVADLLAANEALEEQGFGPDNFSVPVVNESTGEVTHYLMHTWEDPVFVPAVKALPSVVWQEGVLEMQPEKGQKEATFTDDPVARVTALAKTTNARLTNEDERKAEADRRAKVTKPVFEAERWKP